MLFNPLILRSDVAREIQCFLQLKEHNCVKQHLLLIMSLMFCGGERYINVRGEIYGMCVLSGQAEVRMSRVPGYSRSGHSSTMVSEYTAV